ncbi:hypothetical protein EDD18DRAFT_1363309 [Armillaria luteobubalina]|uniref:Uncharacterized protein n=1 Tax=Armillaria luteobubalina TaxID=153913 RepID=A0AA39PC25_9AGAR|nr:hypothetical protein EDD18DRAFT_1363309 [Armillaria luteobubalina]
MALNTQLVLAHDAPLDDICHNLIQVCTAIAQYLDAISRHSVPIGEFIRVVTQVHGYLDVHIDILHDFDFADSHYGLALRSQVYMITSHIPAEHRRLLWKKWYLTDEEALHHEYTLDDELLLPGEDRYKVNGEGCIAEADIWPFCTVELPPPRHPTATPSPKKAPVVIRDPTPPTPRRPKPCAAGSPEPPKELAFSVPGKKLIGIILPLAGSALGGPNTRKCQREQAAIMETLIPVSNVHLEPEERPSSSVKPVAQKAGPKRKAGPSVPISPTLATDPVPSKAKPHKTFQKSPAPNAFKRVCTAKKPHFSPSSESEVPESESEGEGSLKQREPLFFPSDNNPASDKAAPPPAKRACVESPIPEEPSFSVPHAYHPLTGELLFNLRYVNLLAPSLHEEGLSSKAKHKRKAMPPSSPVPASPAPEPPTKKGKKKQLPAPSPSHASTSIAAPTAGPSNTRGRPP